jgi:hypothetical protein
MPLEPFSISKGMIRSRPALVRHVMGAVDGDDGRALEDQALTVSAADDRAAEVGRSLNRASALEDVEASIRQRAGLDPLGVALACVLGDADVHAWTNPSGRWTQGS